MSTLPSPHTLIWHAAGARLVVSPLFPAPLSHCSPAPSVVDLGVAARRRRAVDVAVQRSRPGHRRCPASHVSWWVAGAVDDAVAAHVDLAAGGGSRRCRSALPSSHSSPMSSTPLPQPSPCRQSSLQPPGACAVVADLADWVLDAVAAALVRLAVGRAAIRVSPDRAIRVAVAALPSPRAVVGVAVVADLALAMSTMPLPHASSDLQSAEQPSPDTCCRRRRPRRHRCRARPSPQDSADLQSAEQPSPSMMLPSSHCLARIDDAVATAVADAHRLDRGALQWPGAHDAVSAHGCSGSWTAEARRSRERGARRGMPRGRGSLHLEPPRQRRAREAGRDDGFETDRGLVLAELLPVPTAVIRYGPTLMIHSTRPVATAAAPTPYIDVADRLLGVAAVADALRARPIARSQRCPRSSRCTRRPGRRTSCSCCSRAAP